MPEAARRSVLDEAVYYGLARLFYLAPRLLYDIHIEAPEPPTFPPATLIVANHKRDLDSVVLPSTLLWIQPTPRVPLAFAGREDMFFRGFLAGYDVIPRWLRRLLNGMELTRVMRALRILPVRRFPERTMEEALREALALLGDRRLSDLLTEGTAAAAAGATVPDVLLSQALAWRYYELWRGPARMRAFREPFRARLAARQREVVEAQMAALAAVLNEGGVLYLAPEGVISPDGRLQAFRSGLQQILEAAARPAQIRPVSIVYDFMRPGRLRIFIAMKPAFPARGPAEAARKAREELARLHVMTASQLCSYVVWERARAGHLRLEGRELLEETEILVAHLSANAVRVDPGLKGRGLEGRVGEWIRYALRRGLLGAQEAVPGERVPHQTRLEIRTDALAAMPIGHATNPVRYAVNELSSVCEALDIPLGRGASPPIFAASGLS